MPTNTTNMTTSNPTNFKRTFLAVALFLTGFGFGFGFAGTGSTADKTPSTFQEFGALETIHDTQSPMTLARVSLGTLKPAATKKTYTHNSEETWLSLTT